MKDIFGYISIIMFKSVFLSIFVFIFFMIGIIVYQQVGDDYYSIGSAAFGISLIFTAHLNRNKTFKDLIEEMKNRSDKK